MQPNKRFDLPFFCCSTVYFNSFRPCVLPCSQVGWYNSVLSPNHRLAYPDDTLAVVVLSTPSMFEDAFLPFLKQRGFQGLSDPIDQCVRHCVSSAVLQVSAMHFY